MFIFIYVSFQAEKYCHCPKETKMLIQAYKNRNKNKTLKKEGSCQKKWKTWCKKEELAQKLNKIIGVEVNVCVCPKPISEGQESRESIEDAKGNGMISKLQGHKPTQDINHSPSKFQFHSTDCPRVEQLQYTLPRPTLVQKKSWSEMT